MTISQTLQNIAPSATLEITQLARDMKARGIDVISLASGEPDFDTPEFVKLAAVEAIAEGKTKYTAVDGIPELKRAICAKFKRDNGLDYSEAQINVSPGGKAVLYNALVATLNPGDEVIIPTPCWVSYPEMVKLCGGTPVMAETMGEDHFKLTPKTLEQHLSANTKWLILNSPSNPTGAAYQADELAALAEGLRKYPNVMILCDDIYEHLVYDGFEFATLASVAPDLKDRVLTMNGVSKAFAMTGWRIGYAGGPQWLIKAMAKVMGQTTSNPNSIAQWAAAAALNEDQTFLKRRADVFKARRDMVVGRLNAISLLHCTKPNGAFYVFADCQQMFGKTTETGVQIENDKDFCKAVLKDVHVALVPGSAFYAPGYFRLSYAADEASLSDACARIAKFCKGLT